MKEFPDLSKMDTKLPLVFSVRGCQLVSKFPDGPDELWSADVKAYRYGEDSQIFEKVLFVESNGTGNGIAFIYGIESEDGCPKGFISELALKQQRFIQFLRDDTRRRNYTLGVLALVFEGHEYSNVGKVTAAYIAQRGKPLIMGVGYHSTTGAYELIGVDPKENGSLDAAHATLPFDELP